SQAYSVTFFSSSCFRPLYRFLFSSVLFFFSNTPATTKIYTLSLHDALPICERRRGEVSLGGLGLEVRLFHRDVEGDQDRAGGRRSEEHTSELQSRVDLVCRLLLEKKKRKGRYGVT